MENFNDETLITKINIYSDGSCIKKNIKDSGGNGGWGVYATLHNKKGEVIYKHEDCGGKLKTTNNKMELTGVIEGMKYVVSKNLQDSEVNVYTDSQYIVNSITKWMRSWQKDDRLNPENKNPVKNIEYWLEILQLQKQMSNIKFYWIRGHTKITSKDSHETQLHKKGNEKADELANMGTLLAGKNNS